MHVIVESAVLVLFTDAADGVEHLVRLFDVVFTSAEEASANSVRKTWAFERTVPRRLSGQYRKKQPEARCGVYTGSEHQPRSEE